MLYFEDSLTQIYLGSSLHMEEIPDNSVHCCVTSPPYWGLRSYKGAQELVWCGVEDCKHKWGSPIAGAGKNNDQTVGAKQRTSIGSVNRDNRPTTQFCQKCGAWRGQLGLEPTVELYVEHLLEIFREVKRVLRKDGVLWLNMGDSMASGKGTCYNPGGGKNSLGQNRKAAGVHPLDRGNKSTLARSGLKPLDLCNIPHRVAEALQADGWYWRSTIIWEKPNPMPESVNGWRWERHRVKVKPSARANPGSYHAEAQPDKPQGARDGREFADHASEYADCPGCPKCSPNGGFVLRKGSWRPTSSYEYIFMLTKSNSYFADQDAVREASIYPDDNRKARAKVGQKRYPSEELAGVREGSSVSPTRNLRDVWRFPTQAYAGAHFAVFPEELPERCIKASTSEWGVCPKCGAQWARVIESKQPPEELFTATKNPNDGLVAGHRQNGVFRGAGQKVQDWLGDNPRETLGWRPTCTCHEKDERQGPWPRFGMAWIGANEHAIPVPATILDPFAGAGTTLWVAKKLGRRGIGYELSTEYCRLAVERTRQGGLL